MPLPLTHLGEMSIETFLRDYWQKKPLLIRNAFPDFESPLSPDELAGLALEEEIESRIIIENGQTPWELLNGPFEESIFSQLPEKRWSLLVQAVDQFVPEVNELLDYFRFIPNWRLDDLMISYAPDEGGVGPHFDYYDVFLLQGSGQRRWKLGQMCDNNSPRIEGTRLKILSEFNTTDEWILGPGDMLYIPPGVAHWGEAVGDDCMTFSIGFRAPSHADILSEAGQEIALDIIDDQRFSDPDLQLQDNPGEINPKAIEQLRNILNEHYTDARLAHWFGRYMTERKYLEQMDEELEDIDADQWQSALAEGAALWRHPAARVAFHTDSSGDTMLFADGEAINCSRALAECICAKSEISWEEIKPFLAEPFDVAALSQLINLETLLVDDES